MATCTRATCSCCATAGSGILDWGIVGRLDERTHRFVLRMLAAVLGDERGVATT